MVRGLSDKVDCPSAPVVRALRRAVVIVNETLRELRGLRRRLTVSLSPEKRTEAIHLALHLRPDRLLMAEVPIKGTRQGRWRGPQGGTAFGTPGYGCARTAGGCQTNRASSGGSPRGGRLADFRIPCLGGSVQGTSCILWRDLSVHRADQTRIHVPRLLDYGGGRERRRAFLPGRIHRTVARLYEKNAPLEEIRRGVESAIGKGRGAGGGGWLVAWGRLAGRSHVLAISRGDAFSREERHGSKICE